MSNHSIICQTPLVAIVLLISSMWSTNAALGQQPLPVDCRSPGSCWTLQVQFVGTPTNERDYTIEVLYSDAATPLPMERQGNATLVHLPRFNPENSGYYTFQLNVAHGGTKLAAINFEAPSYVGLNTATIWIPIATPVFQKDTVRRLEADSVSHIGGDETLWRVYFQIKYLLPKAAHNRLLLVPLERALFNACSRLARTSPSFVIYHFDADDCLLDESLVNGSALVDAQLAHWLLYNYNKKWSDQYLGSENRKQELGGILQTLEWLDNLRSQAEEQALINEYHKYHPNSFGLIPSDSEFSTVLTRLRCAVRDQCK